MYSKAKILGHPLHPMLVAFPVAFYTATLVAYIVYGASAEPFWYRFGWVVNWAGVATAAVAALPGLVDWATGIPRGTAAKKTGLIHMGLNSTALVIFSIDAVIVTSHHNDVQPDASGPIVLSAIGLLLTLPAGFLGWSLVQDHHVGVRLSPSQEALERTTTLPERTGAQARSRTPAPSH
jgi:uncharacterized membrane protein